MTSISDLWQRIGRCSRSDSRHGIAVVLVDPKYIVPPAVPDIDLSDPVNYIRFAVGKDGCPDEKWKLKEVIRVMYDTGDTSGLDPGLLWLVNTHGCRHDVFLALFEDEGLEAGPGCKGVLCDNCSLPSRTSYNRRLLPPELRTKKTRNGKASFELTEEGLSLAEKEELQKRREEIEASRIASVVAINEAVVADNEDVSRGVGDRMDFHFQLSATLRYCYNIIELGGLI